MRILILALLFIPNIIWAFNYPTGIPDAWISPDLAAPSTPLDWSNEIENKYYIDISAPNCSSKVTYGSTTVPRCYFPPSLPALAAGAYVEVHGGPYEYTSTVYIRSDGTESEPVWFKGAEDNLVKMHLVLSGTYLYVDGFNLEGDKGISARPYQDRQTDHVMVRNTTITGSGSLDVGTTGLSAGGANGLQFEGFIAYHNTISYMGDSVATVENDRHAMSIGSYINNVWHLYNTTHHNGGDGVQYSHGGTNAHHFYYGGNTSHDERENCVDIKQADDVVISDNICYGIKAVSSASGECMVVHYDPTRIWFINNDISDCVGGIVSSGSSELYIIGNNIHDMKENVNESHGDISSFQTGVGIKAYNTGDILISNNTITDAVRGVAYEVLSGYKATVTNNIITDLKYGVYSENSPYALMIKGNSEASLASIIENNLFYNPTRFYINNKIYTSPSELTTIGMCSSCIAADPLYVDSVTGNYTLQATSPAINAGSISSAYDTYRNLYGEQITTDILGNIRTIDGQPDIGAFEYIVNSKVSPLPLAPSGVYIQPN